MPNIAIDRNSPIPIYYQIETDLKKRIMRREWDVHQQLPTEVELASQYDVSRITLRQALAELEKDSIIRKQRGKGTFINTNPTPFVNNLSYTLVSGDRIKQQPYSIAATILEQMLVTDLFPDVYEHLELKPEDNAVYIKRLFLLNGKPLAIGRSWLPSKIVPGFESIPMINNSLSQTLLRRYQLHAILVEDYLEVVRSTQSECDLLKCIFDTPLVLIRGTSFLEGNRPLEYSNTLWAGDSVRFRFTLRNTEDGFVIGP
ncbi:MAG: GntR family transcriptional regulator [Flexilinea sp.]|jgi:DNA-binding GntR family transcriptional regulator